MENALSTPSCTKPVGCHPSLLVSSLLAMQNVQLMMHESWKSNGAVWRKKTHYLARNVQHVKHKTYVSVLQFKIRLISSLLTFGSKYCGSSWVQWNSEWPNGHPELISSRVTCHLLMTHILPPLLMSKCTRTHCTYWEQKTVAHAISTF